MEGVLDRRSHEPKSDLLLQILGAEQGSSRLISLHSKKYPGSIPGSSYGSGSFNVRTLYVYIWLQACLTQIFKKCNRPFLEALFFKFHRYVASLKWPHLPCTKDTNDPDLLMVQSRQMMAQPRGKPAWSSGVHIRPSPAIAITVI